MRGEERGGKEGRGQEKRSGEAEGNKKRRNKGISLRMLLAKMEGH